MLRHGRYEHTRAHAAACAPVKNRTTYDQQQ